MRVVHAIGNARRTGHGTGRALLTDNQGAFFTFSSAPESDFDGLFFQDAGVWKTVVEIGIRKGTGDEIVQHLSHIERVTQETHERYWLTTNGLVYEVEGYEGDVLLTLDCKRLYDDSDTGRVYSSLHEEDRTIISYTKFADEVRTKQEYQFFLAVSGAAHGVANWRKIDCPSDGRRNMSAERWVYDSIAIPIHGGGRVFIAFARDAESARTKLAFLGQHADELLEARRKDVARRSQDDVVLAVAKASLDALITRTPGARTGIFAGLPWFFQFWARDECLCIPALLAAQRFGLAKEILLSWLAQFAQGNLGAMGAEGVCFRLHQLLLTLEQRRELSAHFTADELTRILQQTRTILDALSKHRTAEGFLLSTPKATWMDTTTNEDDRGREGVRIEIQCLLLRIYDLLLYLGRKTRQQRKELEEEQHKMQQVVRTHFFQGGQLCDGFHPDGSLDERVRPNAFLTWYLFPDLFTKEEWRGVFDHALEDLWLPWGGLSSIGKTDPLFKQRHTGIDNKSYHRGDSWYFLNNIAAMELFAVGPHKYEEKITAILDASVGDLLWDGFCGCASELSDAERRRAAGCYAQAWSSATLIELLTLLKNAA